MAFLALLKILLFLIVAGVSLVSVIRYKSGRRQSKAALSSLRQRTAPIRRLDPGEQRALLPQLHRPTKPAKALSLDSEEVFALQGGYRRHGIESNGQSTLHDMIGDVEVLLPYDARLFLEEENQAEVVFADNLAVVVKLNHRFTLAEGEERQRRREKADEQWRSGTRGKIGDIEIEAGDHWQDQAPARRRRVDIVDQREETEAEILARQGRGGGLLSATFWLCGFLCLWIVSLPDLQDSRPFWLAGGLLMIALALWWFWRPWRPAPAGKVNVVSGALDLHLIPLEQENQFVSTAVTLGDKLPFNLPAHWRPHVEYQQGRVVEAELRVTDYSVVRWDRRLSLDKEGHDAPPVFRGRHLTLAILGALSLACALAWSGSPSADWALTWSLISHQSPRSYQEAEALLAQPPSYGTSVNLTGRGRCQVREGTPPWIDCNWIRWGGARPDGDTGLNDEIAENLISDDFFNVRRDRRLELIAMMQGHRDRDNPPVLVDNLAEVVGLVDRACPQTISGRRFARACDVLREKLAMLVKLPRKKQPRGWSGFRNAVLAEPAGEAGVEDHSQAARAGSTVGVVLRKNVESLRHYARQVGFQRIGKATRQLSRQIAESQTGGVLIRVPDGFDHKGAARDTTTRLWPRLVALAGADGETPFQIHGIVVNRGKTPDGDLLLDVNTGYRLDHPWPAVARSLWVVLAAALLLVHGILVLHGRIARRRRQRALAALYGWREPVDQG